MTAVSAGDLDKANEMIEMGADPNFIGPSGWSAFHWAVQFGLQDVVRFLLSAGGLCETRWVPLAHSLRPPLSLRSRAVRLLDLRE